MSIVASNVILALLSRPGTLVDVGANFGQSTAALLTVKDSHVIAFEPVVQTFCGMCSLIGQANGNKMPENLTMYNLAVGSNVGVIQIAVPYFNGIRWEGRASIVHDFGALSRQTDKVEISHVTQDVLVVPLDLFDFQSVTLLKIDVEGFEQEVLQGAANTIARCKPVIHIEIEEQHRENATLDVPAILKSFGYRGFFFLQNTLRDFADFSREAMQQPPPLPRSGDPYPDPYIFEFVFVHNDDLWGLQRVAEIAAHLWTEQSAQ